MFVAAHSFKANLKTSSLHKLFLELNGPSIRGHPASWSTPEFQLKNSALELTYVGLQILLLEGLLKLWSTPEWAKHHRPSLCL